MATLNQRLQDPGYKAWIKAGLCLSFAKAGLENFADQSSKTFHQAVLNKLRNSGNPSCNGVCNHASIRGGKVSCCNNCHGFVDAIDQQNQNSFRFEQRNWDNSDIQLWPNDPWEMAKVFMNQGQKATQRSPVDTDLSGILNFIDHCVVAKGCIVNTYNIPKVRDVRNKVMHSASMTLNQTELSNFTGAIVDLLEDPGTLSQSKSAQEALGNIRKVMASDFDISKDNEMKVIIERTKILHLKMRLLERNVQEYSESLKQLETTGKMHVVQHQETMKLLQETKLQIHTEIQILKGRIDTYEDIKVEIQLHLKSLDDSLEEVRRVFLVNTRMITAMNEKLEALEAKNSLLMERQTTLERKESHIEDQLHELCNTSVGTGFAAEAKHLQEALIEEYRRIGFEVPLSPIYDGLNDDLLKVNIDELYTDLVIVKPERKEEIRVTSYKDIFRSKGIANRTIFLKGEAGVGKSTWCVQLLYAWVKTHDRDFEKFVDLETDSSYYSKKKMQDLEEAISQFDYMFIVPLRYVKGKTSIKDVTLSPLLERLSSLGGTVRSIIENCSDKVLILLDGIDEYTDDLSYEGLNQCTVITTTRPWKYDHICAMKSGLKIDMLLNLKGLDEFGISHMTKKVYMAINKYKASNMSEIDVESRVSAFLIHVRDSGLTDALKVPLTLIILLEAYIENVSFSNSMTINLVNLLEVLVQRGKEKMLQSDTDSSALKNGKAMNSQANTIALFAENESISEYAFLFQKISKLAFYGITNSQKENAFVFSEKQLNQIFNKDDIGLCFKFGLLSRSSYFTSILSKKKSSVSFSHKLVQEFFAAAWIVSGPEAVDEFKKGIVSVSDILEIANIFVFICGIDAHIGSEISKHFVDVCERDNITYDVIYCPGIFCSHNSINMSSLMLRGQNEVDLSATPDEPLYALDIIISYQPVNENSPLKLLQTSIQCLRFLYLGDAHMHISYNSLSQLIKIIEDAVSLQEINLNDDFVHLTERSDVGDNSQTLYMDFSRHAKIQTVTLTGKFNSESYFLLCLPILSALQSLPDLKHLDLTERGEDPCNILVETFPSLQNFESLSLRNFNISNGDLVVKSKELRNLYIRKVNFENSGIMLINSCKLEFVIIDDLKMSAVGWSLLFEQLRKQNNLIVLELKDIGTRGEHLHLSNNGQLRKLSVTSLGLPALIVYNGTDPDELIIEKVKMPELAWFNLLSAFRFKNLKIIRLTNLDVGHALIDLSQATLLERVSIANVNLCHENTVIKGESATTHFPTSNTGWERFFGSMPTKYLRHLSLYNLDIGTAIIQIEKKSCLCRICLERVKMSRKAFDTLCLNLKTLSKLQIVDIAEVKVEGNIIHMMLEDIKK